MLGQTSGPFGPEFPTIATKKARSSHRGNGQKQKNKATAKNGTYLIYVQVYVIYK